MNDKKSVYQRNRPKLPAEIKRLVEVEAGHACTVKNCEEHTYVEIHHIDENRENNDVKNLILLCDKHHKMAHAKKIDRKSLHMYKELLNTNKTSDIFRQKDIETLKKILEFIRIERLNTIVEELQSDYIRKKDADYFESISYKFNKLFKNNFHLYDEKLEKKFDKFYSNLRKCMDLSNFSPAGSAVNPPYYKFDNANSSPSYQDWSDKHTKYLKDVRETLRSNAVFFKYIKINYVEIEDQ